MDRTLTSADVDNVILVVKEKVFLQPGSGTQPQNLGGVGEVLLMKIAIPILVSVTGSVLGDYLKRKLSGMTRKESEEVIENLQSLPIKPQEELRTAELEQLRSLLAPMGHSDASIQQIYQLVKNRMARN